MPNGLTRRDFLRNTARLIAGLIVLPFFRKIFGGFEALADAKGADMVQYEDMTARKPDHAKVFVSRNGSAGQNMDKVVEMMGGIEKIIGKDDIVILKPNAQWWNQGTTNTNAMKRFIELVLGIPGFQGEVIIAENHHCAGPKNSQAVRGWTTQERNGDFNLYELVDYFQKNGNKNVTKYHWIDVGSAAADQSLKSKIMRPAKGLVKQMLGIKAGRMVRSPADGDGYVWTDIEYAYGEKKVVMNYPIFTSEFSGTTIDFKYGAWRNGKYTGQPVKFINFAGLNHHSDFAGATSSVKNYLGVVDLSKDIPTPEYVNFHYIGIPGMGGAVATFMKTIRKADLNIVTAEWVGFASRTDTALSVRPRAILASTDPVALDYYGTKYILLPLGGPVSSLNDPDNANGPLYRYLKLCSELDGGRFGDDTIEARVENVL